MINDKNILPIVIISSILLFGLNPTLSLIPPLILVLNYGNRISDNYYKSIASSTATKRIDQSLLFLDKYSEFVLFFNEYFNSNTFNKNWNDFNRKLFEFYKEEMRFDSECKKIKLLINNDDFNNIIDELQDEIRSMNKELIKSVEVQNNPESDKKFQISNKYCNAFSFSDGLFKEKLDKIYDCIKQSIDIKI